MRTDKGVLLIALGHYNYAAMAMQLAVSLKSFSPDIPICVITSEETIKHLPQAQKDKYFDKIIFCPRDMYMVGARPRYVRTKTFAYDLSPFDRTILMDVDLIWSQFKPVHTLFDELKDVKFTCINEGYISMIDGETDLLPGYTFWAEKETIKTAFIKEKGLRTGKLYQMRTELLYFERCEKNEKYFELVKEIYREPRVDVSPFAGGIPDEFAFNVASCIMHHYPHKSKWVPIWWHFRHHKLKLTLSKIQQQFYGTSIGGNLMKKEVKEHYDTQAKMYAHRENIKPPYLARPKTEFLTERKLL